MNRSRRVSFGIVVVLLAAFTLWTRASAPWRLDVINDEMHHLESWRNRYGTNDIYPLFVSRIERTGRLKGRKLELFERIYHEHPVLQRGLFVLVDPQPPLFPVMAECIEAASHSSLLALRFPSALASLATVLLMYGVGRTLKDEVLGLWLASLMSIWFIAQVYAGIGRPYALTQCTLALAIYVYLKQVQHPYASPWRFWLAALLAQSTQWMNWAVIGPLAACEVVRLYHGHRSIRSLVRQTWWYAALSLLLLVEMAVQLRNPTISAQSGVGGFSRIWSSFCIASPFAAIGSFGPTALAVAGGVTLALIATGTVMLVLNRPVEARFRWGLLAALLGSLVAPVLIGTSVRFMMSYMIVPTIIAGVACRQLARGSTLTIVALAVLLAGFISLRIWHPQDPYRFVLSGDAPYSQVAGQLHRQLQPGDVWAGWPYPRANCLYRYGPFPEPALPDSRAQLDDFLARRPPGAACYVFTQPEQLELPEFADVSRRWVYKNGLTLVEFAPARRSSWPVSR